MPVLGFGGGGGGVGVVGPPELGGVRVLQNPCARTGHKQANSSTHRNGVTLVSIMRMDPRRSVQRVTE
jgi:hypothetical protein